jgi:hypothetical protein
MMIQYRKKQPQFEAKKKKPESSFVEKKREPIGSLFSQDCKTNISVLSIGNVYEHLIYRISYAQPF